jgi:hypothetical protein
MILPPLQGSLDQKDFFIYAAADRKYFDLYGRALINSVLANTDHGIHLHLYDPTESQLEFCQRSRISVTWEYLSPNQFDSAMEFWSRWDLPEPWNSRKTKMLSPKQYQDNSNLRVWLEKTYYACMRFVRLAEFLDQPRRFLEIDIDGLVRSSFAVTLPNDHVHDIYLYEKQKRDQLTRQMRHTGYLAGSILFTGKPSNLEFVAELKSKIKKIIEDDRLYWFLDQDCLEEIAAKYRCGALPIDYVDWHMQPRSAIWTAKGRRKELAVFQQELDRYR